MSTLAKKRYWADCWRKRNPWVDSYNQAKYRCLNPKNPKYHRYGGRGIKFLMTKEDFKFLWFRDKAYDMKKPSIDRINNDGNYELSNCRFIEFSLNSKLQTKPIMQLDKNTGNLIKIFKSILSASTITKTCNTAITCCARKMKYKITAGGFKWEYATKEDLIKYKHLIYKED